MFDSSTLGLPFHLSVILLFLLLFHLNRLRDTGLPCLCCLPASPVVLYMCFINRAIYSSSGLNEVHSSSRWQLHCSLFTHVPSIIYYCHQVFACVSCVRCVPSSVFCLGNRRMVGYTHASNSAEAYMLQSSVPHALFPPAQP